MRGLSFGLLLPLLAGCASHTRSLNSPQSRTLNPLRPSEIAFVRKVGLHVIVERPFEVTWVQAGTSMMAAAGAPAGAIGVLVAGLADGGVRYNADRKHARPMEARLAKFDLGDELAAALSREIESGGLGITTARLSSTNQAQIAKQECDAGLYVTVLRWGVEPCRDPAAKEGAATNQLAQAKMDLRLTLIERKSQRRLWERLEYHIAGDCRPLDDFKNEDGLLPVRFREGVARVAASIVDEIREAAAPRLTTQ